MSPKIVPPEVRDTPEVSDTPEVADTPEVSDTLKVYDTPEVAFSPIETRLVYGFLDAGKTHYIQDCILNDYFHKYGTTLILSFEQGEESYDPQALSSRRASVACYEGDEDVAVFCRRCIETVRPNRIYVEMNAMMQGLRDKFPECMKVTFSVTFIDWATLPLYFANFKQLMKEMVAASQQVIFRACPSKNQLARFSQPFRLMNQAATYLRQDPMGYHERAFDRFLPYSLDDDPITITEDIYLPFWLDAYELPEHYEGKNLRFTDPLELRRIAGNDTEEPHSAARTTPWSAGRVVMTCCMADLQFMSFELEIDADTDSGLVIPTGGWITLDALAQIGADEYGRRRLKLKPTSIHRAQPPKELIMDVSRGRIY